MSESSFYEGNQVSLCCVVLRIKKLVVSLMWEQIIKVNTCCQFNQTKDDDNSIVNCGAWDVVKEDHKKKLKEAKVLLPTQNYNTKLNIWTLFIDYLLLEFFS